MINRMNFPKSLISTKKLKKYRSTDSEIWDFAILKQILHGHHAANFSCTNLELNPKTMKHSSSDLQSAGTIPKQVFSINFASKI